MRDELFENLGLGCEWLARGIGALELRQDELHDVMLLECFEVHLPVFLFLHRVAERGIEDRLLEVRMDPQLLLDLAEQLLPLFRAALGRLFQRFEQRLDLLVVGLEHTDCVLYGHVRILRGESTQATCHGRRITRQAVAPHQ